MNTQAIRQDKSIKDLIDEQFQDDSLELSAYNLVALELRKLIDSDEVSMSMLVNLIMRDQALASQVVRLANSAFYRGLKRIDTISTAVVRLGMDRVVELARQAAQTLDHSSKSAALDHYAHTLWLHALICAAGNRWIATEMGYGSRAEEAYLAGLLHDIGELYLLKSLEALMCEQSTSVLITLPLVSEVLEGMHTEFGYRLMTRWALPDNYAQIARDHHAESFDEQDELLIITRISDLACSKVMSPGGEADIVLAAAPEAQILGLKEIQLAQLEVLMEDVLVAGRQMFSAT